METRSDVALHKAAMSGDVQAARRLLDTGRVHVDVADPVHIASPPVPVPMPQGGRRGRRR